MNSSKQKLPTKNASFTSPSFAMGRKITKFLLWLTTFLVIIFLFTSIFRLGYYMGENNNNNSPFDHHHNLKANQKPNFILFMGDDLGYGDLSCYGSPDIRTPNIDSLAYEGMKLTQFYVTPWCSPTRSALLTGRDPIRNGVYNSRNPINGTQPVFEPTSYGMLPTSEILISNLLQNEGYYTGLFGKWHLGTINETALPLQRGFNEFWGIPYASNQGCPPSLEFPCTSNPNFVPVPLYDGNEIIEQPTTYTDFMPRLQERALDFISTASVNEQPFFLFVAFITPHTPLFSSPEFDGVSERGPYGDAVEEIDYTVGQIMQRVKDLSLDDNTLVVFTSDNGPATSMRILGGSSGQLRSGKGTTYEGGVRAPAIFNWPGRILGNTENFSIASITDIFTTFITLAGGEIPQDRFIDGLDLSNVLFNNDILPRECITYYYQSLLTAVRCGEYKYHYYTKDDATQLQPADILYNIAEDCSEQYPLDQSQYSSVLDEINYYLNDIFYPELILGPAQIQLVNRTEGAYQPCCDIEKDCYCPANRVFSTHQGDFYLKELNQLIADGLVEEDLY